MRDRRLRTAAASALGLGLAGLFWTAFTGPFPLAEFCSRNRPTWVFPLFEEPRYTALIGHQFLLAMAAASGLYLAALRLAAPLRGRAAAILLLGVVPLALALVLTPAYPLLSNDIFKYVFDGRIMAVYGDNPFLRVPAEYPDDRFYDLVHWRAVVNAHGPLWRVAEAAAAHVGGENCRAAVLAMKAWPILAYLATTLVIFLLLRRWRPDSAIWGSMAYAWNPVVVLEAVQNGHNDVVAALPAVAAVVLAVQDRFRLAFPALAIAALFKPLAVVLGPLLVIAAARQGTCETQRDAHPDPLRTSPEARRRRFVDVAIGLGLSAIIVLVAYVPFWAGLATLQGLSRGDLFSTSPAAVLFELLQGSGLPADRALDIASGLATLLFFALLALLLLALSRGRVAPVTAAAATFFLYLLVAAQWFNPWYMLWLVPFAALAGLGPALGLTVTFSLLSPILYAVPDNRLVVLLVFLPVALLALRWHGWLGWPIATVGAARRPGRSPVGPRPALWSPVGEE